MSEALDFPVGEYPDVTTVAGLCKAIDRITAEALTGFAELKAERDKAISERDAALAERDTWRARAYGLAGPLP